jgi:hypothetical protein
VSRNQTKEKKKLIEQLKKMPIVELACKNLSLPRATYYRWRQADQKFADACDEAIEQSSGMVSDMAESQLIKAIKEKNMTAIIFWLKHHHPRYTARLLLEGRIRHETEVLTPEQEGLVLRALTLAGLLPRQFTDNTTKESSDGQRDTQ